MAPITRAQWRQSLHAEAPCERRHRTYLSEKFGKPMPNVRSASLASSSVALTISSRRFSVNTADSEPTSSCEQSASSTSGAPFVKTTVRSCPEASRSIVLINLRSEENGTSAIRMNPDSRCAGSSPARCAPNRSAPPSDRPGSPSRRRFGAVPRCWPWRLL